MYNLLPFALLLLSVLPSGHAGPACTKKHYKTVECVQKCGARWGYSGSIMGTDPWGVVLHKGNASKKAMAAALAQACGTPTVSTKDGDEEETKLSGAVGNGPDAEDTPIDESTPITSSTASPSPTTISTAVPTSLSTVANFLPDSGLTSSSKKSSSTRKPSPTPPTTTTQPRPTPDPTPTPKPPVEQPPPSNQGGDIGEYLKGHNNFRAKHGAAPLTWNDNLASKAQIWANKCVFEHSGGQLGKFGENLAAGTGSAYGIANGIKSWTDEVVDYNPNAPVASHFTQVVWKNSKQVGCALALCDGIFEARFGKAKYVVCEYDPPGNFNNDFARNVQV